MKAVILVPLLLLAGLVLWKLNADARAARNLGRNPDVPVPAAIAEGGASTLAVDAGDAAPGDGTANNEAGANDEGQQLTSRENETMTSVATFGAGCFWCVEAVFQELKGVTSVVSGYMGGDVENPTYKEVCNGTTGHAEVAQITYDPSVVDFAGLLEVFWQTHDPTTLNRQGADVGTQYRSAVFYHDDAQRKTAEAYKQKLDASGAFVGPIVTEIVPASLFYPAENYHQEYFRLNPEQGYCQAVVRPKVEKFRKVFAERLKDSAPTK
jgi:peptide-methionine (S)-S-oxide reductase